MAKIFMPELSAEERLQIMHNHADHVEDTEYEKDLSEEELIAKKDQAMENDFKLDDLEAELKKKKAEIKNKIEPIKLKNKDLKKEIRTKKKVVKGKIFHMANHTESMMETYDHTGEMVFSRRLRPEEKAPTRLFVAKPAANE